MQYVCFLSKEGLNLTSLGSSSAQPFLTAHWAFLLLFFFTLFVGSSTVAVLSRVSYLLEAGLAAVLKVACTATNAGYI
jgi:hypothetical protein